MLTGPDPRTALRPEFDPREALRSGLHPIRWSCASTLTAVRAYFDLLKGLCLLSWDELGKPNGAELVRILREKWDADLKAANGTAAKAQRKVLAQGKELADLQAAHMRLRGNLAKVQSDRDMLKALLQQVAPGVHNAWLLTQQITRNADIPQTYETHGD